ncbi:MAG: ABC transporter permease, partial [Fimbriimonadaceae bacterium]
MLRDLRLALRSIRQSPASAVVAIVVLGLGIGANTALFSVADGILFRPLLLPDLDRLIAIQGGGTGEAAGSRDLAAGDVYDIARRAESLASVGFSRLKGLNLSGDLLPENIRGASVSANFFEVVGIQPAFGRGFRAGEDAQNARVAVLSDELWRSRFGADPAILGKQVRLNGELHEIVGVTPAAMSFPASAEAWILADATPRFRTTRGDFHLRCVARLKSGVTVEAANTELNNIGRQLAQEHPNTNKGRTLHALLVREMVSGQATASYTRLSLYSMALLLLVACGNVANILFARFSGRVREIAVRQALGASRGSIIRQLLMESVVLSGGGLLVAALLAFWGIDVLKSGMPPEVEIWLPGWRRIGMNSRALLYGTLLALAASLAAGCIPAWMASTNRAQLMGAIRDGGRGMSSGRNRKRLQGTLA